MTDNTYPFDLTRRPPNFFAFGGVDRLAHVRERESWLDELLAQPETRLVPVWRSRNLFADLGNRAIPPTAGFPTVADAGRLVEMARYVVFLGDYQGIAHIGIDLSPLDEETVNLLVGKWGQFSDLREIGPLVERFEGAVMAYARGLMFWHSRHGFCGICGHQTVLAKGGHQRNCSNPDCGASHFPRTDPAVIMLIYKGDNCLLGRSRHFMPRMYSTLAGFVETGETLEEAVSREVLEETAIIVDPAKVRYWASQPWPFPASLMLGFHAEAESEEIIIDEEEMEDARWVHRSQLDNLEEIGMKLPRRDSIAYRLIVSWMNGEA